MRRLLPEHFRLFLLLSLITSTLLSASNAVAAATEFATRPTVGLVLSGGGARGAAHVGVIKILDELQIPVDYVAGTSMGAIVAGLYATGMPAAELEQVFKAANWSALLADRHPVQGDLFGAKAMTWDFWLISIWVSIRQACSSLKVSYRAKTSR